MNRILFSADLVKEIVDFAWRAFEVEFGCEREALEVWPELAINGSVEGGIVLFPVVELEGALPVAYAQGCHPNYDSEWRMNSDYLLNGVSKIVPIPMESVLDCLKANTAFLELLEDVDGEVSLEPVAMQQRWSSCQDNIDQKILH